MEEKNTAKTGLLIFCLIIAIIAIIVMGIFLYKTNSEKTKEIKKSTELQAQVNDLNDTVTGLQGRIDDISNEVNKTNENTTEVNNNTENEQSSSKNSSSIESSTSVADSNEDSVSNKILGSWEASKVVDLNGNDLGLNTVFGSGIGYSNEMIFKENGILSYMIGVTASSDDGEYIVNGNEIKYGVPTDIKGEMTWRTLTYIPEEDILEEELDWTGEKQIVTYVRAD